MNIHQILANTQNPDASIRKNAEEQLSNALQVNMGELLLTLVNILNNENENNITIRQMAGLYLKNVLTAKDAYLRQNKIDKWLNLDVNVHNKIKAISINTLNSNIPTVRHTAAQLVASIGAVELPIKQWDGLLTILMDNIRQSNNEGLIHSSLETLGYMCEEIEETSIDPNDVNQMLTAIVDGIRSNRSINIRLAAITALRNSIDFMDENFKNDDERNHIMTVICEATQCYDEVKIRVIAYECLAAIATCYYKYLSSYMNVLYELTFKAIKEDEEEVSLQAMDFWSSICEVEIDLTYEEEETGVPNNGNKHFIKHVLNSLIPVICNALEQKINIDEYIDNDNWNLSVAAGTCLSLVAQAVKDECVDIVLEYIKQNIGNNEIWYKKESAISAFGSILDGPSSNKIGPIIIEAMPILLPCMKDKNILIRDTTAWVIGRICELHSKCITGQLLEPLMQVLAIGISYEPRVASHICYAIHNLAKAFLDSRANNYDVLKLLDPYFSVLFDELLKCSQRTDSTESSLRAASLEALSTLIQAGSENIKDHIILRIPYFLDQLDLYTAPNNVLANQNGHGIATDVSVYQVTLCSILLSIAQRGDIPIVPYADRIMTGMLHILGSNVNKLSSTASTISTTVDDNTQSSAAAEDAFLLIGSIASTLNKDFIRYMAHFAPYLINALNNGQEYMVCTAAVGVVGDLCRALEKEVLPYCDAFILALLSLLRNTVLPRNIKPTVLSCFGDIALSIEGNFERFIQPVMEMMIQASKAASNIGNPEILNDEDYIDHINQLRESILESITGIVQGLSSDNKETLLINYLQQINDFIRCVGNDIINASSVASGPNDIGRLLVKNNQVITTCVGLIGDIIHTFKKNIVNLIDIPLTIELIKFCREINTKNAIGIANWAEQGLNELRK